MSVRTFTRRFRDETGQSPAAWLARQRVERARLLLETTDLPVDEVARRSGFGTGVSMRTHLHAHLGVGAVGLPPHVQRPDARSAKNCSNVIRPSACSGVRWWPSR